MSKAAEDFVEAKLSAGKVVVFSKTYCPYCTKAKDTFKKYNLPKDKYEIIELDEMDDGPDGDEIQAYMKKKTGGSSVPRVFVDKKFIGGGDDTVKLDKNGDLKKMLQEIGLAH